LKRPRPFFKIFKFVGFAYAEPGPRGPRLCRLPVPICEPSPPSPLYASFRKTLFPALAIVCPSFFLLLPHPLFFTSFSFHRLKPPLPRSHPVVSPDIRWLFVFLFFFFTPSPHFFPSWTLRAYPRGTRIRAKTFTCA